MAGIDAQTAIRTACREVADAKFDFGTHDCCQFARRVVSLIRGEDPAPDLAYEGEDGAARIIEQHHGLRGLLVHLLGEPIDVEALETGDVCLVRLGKVELVGIVTNGGRAIAPMPRGLDFVPLRLAVCGWPALPETDA